jgi:hypothetical protein
MNVKIRHKAHPLSWAHIYKAIFLFFKNENDKIQTNKCVWKIVIETVTNEDSKGKKYI